MNKIIRGAATIGALTTGLAIMAPATAMAGFGGGSSPRPASNNLVIQKVDAATGNLLTGARFTGDNCSRGQGDLNWSCEQLTDYNWFRDNLPEFGTTPTYDGGFQSDIPITDSYATDGTPATLDTTTDMVHVRELTPPFGYNAIRGIATVYRSGNIWKADDLPAGVSLVSSNNYYYLRFADTRITPVYPTKHTTTATTPVTTTGPVTTSKTVCSDPATTYQVDAYTPATTAQAAAVQHLFADRKLTWREDKALWGHSQHEFVTIKASAVKAASSLGAAINAATRTVPNLGGRVAKGATYTTAWALTGAATAAQPWGTAHNQDQVLFTAAPAPSAKCTTVNTTTTVTKTVLVPVVTTTWVCPDGTVVPNGTTACRVRLGSQG